mgnify:CR=1 FL=1
MLWAGFFFARAAWEAQTVESIPVRFLSYQTDEQTGLTVHKTERLDTPQPEPMDLYVFPTRFSQVQAGDVGVAYIDKEVPYIVYDQAPDAESFDGAVGLSVFGLLFLGMCKLVSIGLGGISAQRRIKDGVFVRAKVLGSTQSSISINKVPLIQLKVMPSDSNALSGVQTQFVSAPMLPETAELYPQGMEVPLWVDPKNPKKHWVGIPYF